MTNSADPISWLPQKPTDLDLHCLQWQGISGFSRTRIKGQYFRFSIISFESVCCLLYTVVGSCRLIRPYAMSDQGLLCYFIPQCLVRPLHSKLLRGTDTHEDLCCQLSKGDSFCSQNFSSLIIILNNL